MSQAKPGALSTRGNSNAVPFTALGFLIVPFVAAMALAVILEPHPSSGAADSAIDPLLAPSLIEFRRDERLGAAPDGDLLLAPSLIEFRRSERLGAAPDGDLLLAPSLIEFRRSERLGTVGDQ